MSEYKDLAHFYDRLTQDVHYRDIADYYEMLFRRAGLSIHTVLDLACGTGSMTWEMAGRGYEMIGTDQSVEMLDEAQKKAEGQAVSIAPLWLCQSMERLDLYGTVDAAICCLDGMNYAEPATLREIFRRLLLFLEPGGILIFDILPPLLLRAYDGETFVDETEDVLCLWRAEFDEEENACFYGMDIFIREQDSRWRRSGEEHVEYAHDPQMLRQLLADVGFEHVELFGEMTVLPPDGETKRVYITARKPRDK